MPRRVRKLSFAICRVGFLVLVRYLSFRLALVLPLLLGLTLIIFVIARILPGDPVGFAAGPYATAEERLAIASEYGLDLSLPQQYQRYVSRLAEGNFGRSLMTRRPVASDLQLYLPATLELVGFALMVASAVGVPLGLIAGARVNQRFDVMVSIATPFAVAVPPFFLGLILQLLFSSTLGWLPLSGRLPFSVLPPETVTGFLTIDSLIGLDFDAFNAALVHLILPVITMALAPMATIARVTRSSTIEALKEDYVLTERALGLGHGKIVFKYVFRNAASATMTTIGLYVGWLLGSAVLVEKVFDWPGIGLYATNAILNQDFDPVIAVSLCIGTIFIAANLVVDLLYGVLNPRVARP